MINYLSVESDRVVMEMRLRDDRRGFFQGIEWVIIIAAIALLLFGAKKIPELARGMGRASKEFKRGQLEVDEEIKEQFKEDGKVSPEVLKTAKSLGIKTKGKSEKQLKEEISAVRKKKGKKDEEE